MIERAKHKKNYTMIQNEIAQDKRISFEARGLLMTMLTFPDDWNFSVNGLINLTGKSRATVLRYVKELKENGYIEQTTIKGEKGHFSACEWSIREVPAVSKNGSAVIYTPADHRSIKNGSAVKPECRNLDRLPINISNQEIYITKTKEKSVKEKTTKKFIPPTIEEVRTYCQERKNTIDAEAFVDYYTSNGWKVGGKSPMKDWKAAVRTWEKRDEQRKAKTQPITENPFTRLRREEGFE